jgi:hypothetical protein
MLIMSSFRENVTDKEQEDLETATFDSGVPVFTDEKTRVVSRGRGGAEREIGGVVVPASDKIGTFESDTIGKA